jgi:HEPN domain-containing protein
MLTKVDLEALAVTRLEDAILLLDAGRSSSAYYLAGYAVELALKACVAKAFQPNAIPDKAFVNEIYTHSLEKLPSTAGLLKPFSAGLENGPTISRCLGYCKQMD